MTEVAREYKRVYVGLSSEGKAKFLAFLIFRVSLLIRANYPEAQEGDTLAISNLIFLNEMVRLISKQLLATSGVSTFAYLNDLFFDELLEYAEKGNCKRGTIWAVDTALKDIDT